MRSSRTHPPQQRRSDVRSAALVSQSSSSRSLRNLPVLCGYKLFAPAVLFFASLAVSQTASTPSATVPPRSTALIMLDPAHGGSDSGAALNAAFPEKDVTLVFARRLRQELTTRGVTVQLLREGDSTLTTDQRAAMVNVSHPALYIVIHATSQGHGIRLFTAILPTSDSDSRGPFVAWNDAQSSSLARSRVIVNQIAVAAEKSAFPVRALSASLRPLNNVEVPALAIEIAPSSDGVSQLASSGFQQTTCAALANALASIVPLLKAESLQAGQ
jgi:N-acetylmuramoyl-L-alanine amidase